MAWVSQRAAAAVPEYVEGVQEDDTWEQNTAAAEANYQAGVTKAAQQKRFSGGVKRAGQAKYREGVTTKGAGRYAEGVAGAGDNWESGFTPYRDALERPAPSWESPSLRHPRTGTSS